MWRPHADVLTMESDHDAELTEFAHAPVMLDEIVELVVQAPAGVYADLTLGGAGHAQAVLEARSDMELHGFDQDEMALRAASARLGDGERITLHDTRFDGAARHLEDAGVDTISAFLMDLGVSSPQLDIGERGFSFRHDGPLDMRMDTRQRRTAAEVVNTYAPGELIDVLASYGDERHAKRIVNAIMANRPFESTAALAAVVMDAVPAAVRRNSTVHPATKTFQALRIEVNDELAILGDTIDDMISLLAPGGVGLVLTYHSGEDRIAKDRMRDAIDGDTLPGMPSTSEFSWTFRGARTPSDAEVATNPRARSARLRSIRRAA